jgi:hypothetical protein
VVEDFDAAVQLLRRIYFCTFIGDIPLSSERLLYIVPSPNMFRLKILEILFTYSYFASKFVVHENVIDRDYQNLSIGKVDQGQISGNLHLYRSNYKRRKIRNVFFQNERYYCMKTLTVFNKRFTLEEKEKNIAPYRNTKKRKDMTDITLHTCKVSELTFEEAWAAACVQLYQDLQHHKNKKEELEHEKMEMERSRILSNADKQLALSRINKN